MVKTFDDYVKKSKEIHGIFEKKYQIILIINKDVLIVLKLIN